MPERLTSLPSFTCIGENNLVDLWPGSDATTFSQGNEIGRSRAADLVEVIRRTQSPMLLGHVIEAIAARGNFGGVETGFFHGISMELLTPHVLREFVTVPPERQFRVARKMGHLAVVQSNDDAVDEMEARLGYC